jgi:hypothetical protein
VAVRVYIGDAVDDLTEGASVADPFAAYLSFDAVAGTTYSIAVYSVGDYAAVRPRPVVTPDTVSRDELRGERGTDWLWSADPRDLLDIAPPEV